MQFKPQSMCPPHGALLPAGSAMRRGAAAALHTAGRALQRMSARLAAAPAPADATSQLARLEFHAESGAPEGALYVDGQLVAHLAGVRRL
jgi:RecB family exonuclease